MPPAILLHHGMPWGWPGYKEQADTLMALGPRLELAFHILLGKARGGQLRFNPFRVRLEGTSGLEVRAAPAAGLSLWLPKSWSRIRN